MQFDIHKKGGKIMDSFHLTFNKENKNWKFQKEGGKRPLKNAKTKSEMIEFMKQYMSKKKGSVKIHKQDGKIQEERTYPRSADPKKSKG